MIKDSRPDLIDDIAWNNKDIIGEIQNCNLQLSEATHPVKNAHDCNRYLYLGANYNYILAPIMERIAGKSFGEIIREKIIASLVLRRTLVFDGMQYDVTQNRVFVKDHREMELAQRYNCYEIKYKVVQNFNYDSMYFLITQLIEMSKELVERQVSSWIREDSWVQIVKFQKQKNLPKNVR